MNKLPLSVCIVSYNEENSISRTLESVKDIASEIIIVDSHSEDTTCKIAENYGATIYKEDWKGHIAQKNSALDKCSCEWILSIDCDEVVTDELKQDIINKLKSAECNGYKLNRKTYYSGKFLNFAWQPDWKLRLVKNADKPRWGGIDPHDKLKIDGKVGKLKGSLYHYSFDDIYDHFNSTVKYARIAAAAYNKKGRKFHLHNIILNPFLKFIRSYIIRLGFLDGIRGLLVAFSAFLYTLLKYILLWEIQRKNR